jgi:hypothetical protein
VIITGADDQIADVGRQSKQLHSEVASSEFVDVPGMGHMIHHLSPEQVIRAVDRAAERSLTKSPWKAFTSKRRRLLDVQPDCSDLFRREDITGRFRHTICSDTHPNDLLGGFH